jgi:hypothetical protein
MRGGPVGKLGGYIYLLGRVPAPSIRPPLSRVKFLARLPSAKTWCKYHLSFFYHSRVWMIFLPGGLQPRSLPILTRSSRPLSKWSCRRRSSGCRRGFFELSEIETSYLMSITNIQILSCKLCLRVVCSLSSPPLASTYH